MHFLSLNIKLIKVYKKTVGLTRHYKSFMLHRDLMILTFMNTNKKRFNLPINGKKKLKLHAIFRIMSWQTEKIYEKIVVKSFKTTLIIVSHMEYSLNSITQLYFNGPKNSSRKSSTYFTRFWNLCFYIFQTKTPIN